MHKNYTHMHSIFPFPFYEFQTTLSAKMVRHVKSEEIETAKQSNKGQNSTRSMHNDVTRCDVETSCGRGVEPSAILPLFPLLRRLMGKAFCRAQTPPEVICHMTLALLVGRDSVDKKGPGDILRECDILSEREV